MFELDLEEWAGGSGELVEGHSRIKAPLLSNVSRKPNKFPEMRIQRYLFCHIFPLLPLAGII